MTWIKICGVTSVEDAELALAAGADAIGVNLVPASKRCVTRGAAAGVVRAVRGRATSVAVVADLGGAALREVIDEVAPDRLQLHGHEPTELVLATPAAFKAVRIADAGDVTHAAELPGDVLLVDAHVAGALGGTGQRFDWRLVTELARVRRLVLAGGLHADNVEEALALVRPWGVDVASGVEISGDPRRKDPLRVRRFIERVRAHDARVGADAGERG